MDMGPDTARPAAELFHRRMLWREPERLEPVVALLGPSGAGKSAALEALAGECGGTVLHARLDFAVHDVEPIPAAALVTFELMRRWTNTRHGPTFHRFGLGLLALNEQLPADRAQARDRIAELIRLYVRGTGPGRFAGRMGRAADAVVRLADGVAAGTLSHIGAAPAAEIIEAVRERARPAIGALLRGTARLWVLRALRWWNDRVAGDEHYVDSLIRLSRAPSDLATSHLLRALLADIRENAVKRPPLVSDCDCLVPGPRGRRERHGHCWMLLVDNADTVRGHRFLTELAAARCLRAAPDDSRPAQSDPLLVVGAYGTWQAEWGRWWCEPWRARPRPDSAQRRVPLFSRATHELWAGRNAPAVAGSAEPSACWYPVWLDPMDAEHTTRRLALRGADRGEPGLGALAHRLSGGHRGAVAALETAADDAPRGATGLLNTVVDGCGAPLWQWAVERCVPGSVGTRPWARLPEIAVAGGYLADRQGEGDGRLPAELAALAATLDSLRRHLWISTFAARPSRLWTIARGDADHPAVLHPWPARCLLFGLAGSTACSDAVPAGPEGWDGLFLRLSAALVPGPAAGAREDAPGATARALYYDLALGGFARVAAALAARFDHEDHRGWLRLLDDVTTAPCRQLASCDPVELYQGLLAEFAGSPTTPVQMVSAKLVALLWLCNDSLVTPDRAWDKEIHEAFDRLANNSTRSDVGPLREAAARFAI